MLTNHLTVSGEVLRPCSMDFLLALCLEVMKARAFRIMCVNKNIDLNVQNRRLRFLKHELSRLQQHPQLFESNAARVRFYASLGVDSRLQFSKACIDLLFKDETRRIMQFSRTDLARRTYLNGSKAWENFLLNGAPGTSINSTTTIPKSAYQIIPAVGLRIIADYEREEADIVRFVEQVSETLVSLTTDCDRANIGCAVRSSTRSAACAHNTNDQLCELQTTFLSAGITNDITGCVDSRGRTDSQCRSAATLTKCIFPVHTSL